MLDRAEDERAVAISAQARDGAIVRRQQRLELGRGALPERRETHAAAVAGELHLGLTVDWIGAGMGVLTVLVLIRLLHDTSASHVGALLLPVPAVTALASAPVLGETLHPLSFLGMLIAAAGVGTALSRRPRVERHGARGGQAGLP